MLDDEVWRYLPLGPLPTAVVALVGLALLIVVAVRRSVGVRRLAVALLVVTALAVLAVTLGEGDPSLGRSVSLRPGAGIRGELGNLNQGLGVVNVIGNVVMFVPLGWLVAVLALSAPRSGTWSGVGRGALAGLGFSVVIEASQLFLGRSADVDDVLLNTAGAVLGAAIGAALSRARRGRGA